MEAVIDTNVLIHGRGKTRYDEVYIVQEVLDEAKSSEARNRLRNMDYSVWEPSQDSLEEVKQRSDDINSPTSEADEKLLALALEKDITMVTDDKPLQNLALHLDVSFEGFLDDPAEEKFRWQRVCENCGRQVSGESCPSCGSTRLRRRQVRCS